MENKTKLKYVDMYENSIEDNDNNNLCSDLVSVSEQVKNRKKN